MADQIRVQAAPGRRVVDPATRQPIPADGVTVNRSDVFWHRRLATGDVVEMSAPRPAPAKKEG